MKVLLLTIAFLKLSSALMTVGELEVFDLLRCYDTNAQDSRRQQNQNNINGQALPLPNTIETFISLVERYESLNPNDRVRDVLGKLLRSFRIDDLSPVVQDEVKLKDTSSSIHNTIKRLIFQVPDTIRTDFPDESQFTADEKCALHFMLSHTVNDTRADEKDELIENTFRVKQPREFGVVSLHSSKKHAFALGRVLLGIYAAFLPSNTQDLTVILQREKRNDNTLQGIKINVVYAVTIGDLITRLIKADEIKLLPNGEWTDTSCPIEYKLSDNNGGYVTYSELLGAVDGLTIGRKIQEYRTDFEKYKLSQILRQYYGYSGLVDSARTRWCSRETNFQNVPGFDDDMFNYYKLFRTMLDKGSIGPKTQNKIQTALSEIRSNIFKDLEMTECSVSELSLDRKYVSPRNIFAILDYSSASSTKLQFQAEVIGNLSSDLDSRPRGNLMGVYTNLKPLQQNTLDIVVKNTGVSGCPSCSAKYYPRTGNKEDDAELFKDINDTLTNFDREQENYMSEMKEASPGKIILLFYYGSSNAERRVYDEITELKRHFRGATILAIGDRKESLTHFVDNDQTDIFTSSAKTIYDLKQRINKIPGEFTFRECNRSSSATEADNKQEAFIPPNKIQYWAMYPQYFLKSYRIEMKFRPQEGANIRVCFSRSYSSILEGGNIECIDSSSGEIRFTESNPCYKLVKEYQRNVWNCNPFYFSVEGKKQPNTPCLSLRCSTPYDIQFQFEHQGISCNAANYLSVSTVILLLAALIHYGRRQ